MEVREAIQKAQRGDPEARNELVKLVKDNGAMKQVNRYLYANRLLEPDDVKSEFWLGVIKSIERVRWDIGNPLQFLTWKGLIHIKKALKRVIQKEVIFTCYECGNRGKYQGKTCPKCKSGNIETYQVGTETIKEDTLIFYPRFDAEVDIEKFIETLTQRENDVFFLLLSGYDRLDSCNYLKEIGAKLRISAQRVSSIVKSIRAKYTGYVSHLDRA